MNMEPLLSYINEAVDINNDGYYAVVTLVRHDGLDCANMAADKFVDLLAADLEKATDEYKGLVHGEAKENRQKYIARISREAKEFAALRWKTDKRRQEYIDRAVFNAENAKKYLYENYISFDFLTDPSVSRPMVCTGLSQDTPEVDLKKCFNEVSKSKYWAKATGWTFKYECSKNSRMHSFRPWIELILDESTTAERKREQDMLNKSIEDFYKGTKYWGD